MNKLFGKLACAAPSGVSARLHLRFSSPLISKQTYPQGWLAHYTNNAYGLRDPMVAWGLSVQGAVRWAEMDIPDPFDILGQAAGFGLKYGVAVSCGPLSSRTIVGVARSDREFSAREMGEIEGIVLQMHEASQPPEALTQAQSDALRCIANGDRYAAAAAKLKISESALKARLTSARVRLLARTTPEAIQRAREYRLM